MARQGLSNTQGIPTPKTPQERCNSQLNACDGALKAAGDLIDSQDKSIKDLTQGQKVLEEQLAEAKALEASMPWWLEIICGIAIGLSLGIIIHK